MSNDRSQTELWDRCQSTVEQLDLPDPFDAEVFIGVLARERGRPIGLLPTTARPDAPCGLVITTRNADWIVYCSDTNGLHRQHILLHEAAHILCGHTERGDDDMMAAAARRLMPHLPAELVRSVLGRTVYSEPDEREAELVASLILQRVARRDRHRSRTTDRASTLDALFAVFEG
ncbi:hypothetical protein ABIA35_008625 [Catenulispora sp. MAP12-49]|uniref:hypothetical protein n=1 Tax=Catenulispora sp. MAP12-49 TaxID=3156302 RepID=UPI0035189E15